MGNFINSTQYEYKEPESYNIRNYGSTESNKDLAYYVALYMRNVNDINISNKMRFALYLLCWEPEPGYDYWHTKIEQLDFNTDWYDIHDIHTRYNFATLHNYPILEEKLKLMYEHKMAYIQYKGYITNTCPFELIPRNINVKYHYKKRYPIIR